MDNFPKIWEITGLGRFTNRKYQTDNTDKNYIQTPLYLCKAELEEIGFEFSFEI